MYKEFSTRSGFSPGIARHSPQAMGRGDEAMLDGVRRLKADYVRTLDGKLWPEFSALLAESCEYAVYRDPASQVCKRRVGRSSVVDSIRRTIGDATTRHSVTAREIRIEAPERASAIWDMSDEAEILTAGRRQLFRGGGFYEENYVLSGGLWLILRLTLRRTWTTLE
jgi:hypothetical protein